MPTENTPHAIVQVLFSASTSTSETAGRCAQTVILCAALIGIKTSARAAALRWEWNRCGTTIRSKTLQPFGHDQRYCASKSMGNTLQFSTHRVTKCHTTC
ncbi:hypothetical protein TRVL_09023 [Trypanosoma vivax]|nr:hypothetical protein TRVL_09023 [Trypanosoma vivax]